MCSSVSGKNLWNTAMADLFEHKGGTAAAAMFRSRIVPVNSVLAPASPAPSSVGAAAGSGAATAPTPVAAASPAAAPTPAVAANPAAAAGPALAAGRPASRMGAATGDQPVSGALGGGGGTVLTSNLRAALAAPTQKKTLLGS